MFEGDASACQTGGMHETAARLIRAAEELLREQGEAATSLRDVTDRAGTNVAAVSYHFRSKSGLFSEVFGRALEEVTERQRQRIGSLPAQSSLRDLVEVWLGPGLNPQHHDPRELALWELIARGSRERAPALLAHLRGLPATGEDEIVRLLAAHLPHLSREELHLRHAASIAALSALSAGDLDAPLRLRSGDAATKDMLLDWLVAGLSGPPSGSSRGS